MYGGSIPLLATKSTINGGINRLVYSFNRNKQERRQVIRNQLHLSFLLKLKKLKVVLRGKTRKQHPER